MNLTLPEVHDIVAEHAGFRRNRVLQPLGGKGDKIFPPTYPNPTSYPTGSVNKMLPVHAFETRWIDGTEVPCVILDTVQSRANRFENALLSACDRGDIQLPHFSLEFTDPDLREEIGRNGHLTSLEAPHRIFDAALRDSLLEGTPLMSTALGQRLARARMTDASAVLETSPHSLVFGAWHSQGDGGGRGAKFPRILASEIIGVSTPVERLIDPRTGENLGVRTAARRPTSRVDPLAINKANLSIFKGPQGDWWLEEREFIAGAKVVPPSKINHGHIMPSIQPLGVTMAYAMEYSYLSFSALRQLSFGNERRSETARTYLATLGLLAFAEQERCGYALRSRCTLVPEGTADWAVVLQDGKTQPFNLTRAEARELYTAALSNVLAAGFQMHLAPIKLQPQNKLLEIIRLCRSSRAGLPENEQSEAC